jgi:RNA methyltransferase, TrmH family
VTGRPARPNQGRPPHERELVRICGLAAVRALFERDPGRVERLFFEDAMAGRAERFCRALAGRRKPYRRVDRAELARVAGTVLHGGIVAVARPQPIAELDGTAVQEWARDGKPLLVLDGIGNPHNLGAIARSAAFFGLSRVVLADRPDQALPSDASYRIAEGGFEHLRLYRGALPAAFIALRPHYRVVGAALGCSPLPQKWPANHPIALVLGNEETGLAPATSAACDGLVTIPGVGQIQSLNAAAAAAILIYLVTRK